MALVLQTVLLDYDLDMNVAASDRNNYMDIYAELPRGMFRNDDMMESAHYFYQDQHLWIRISEHN